MHCIGLDVHSQLTAICVLDDNGKTVRETVVRGSLRDVVVTMRQLRKDLGPVKVCYEASCGYGWVHEQLTAMGCKVQVAHPGKVRMIFRAKRKNDRIDARKLATLLYLDQVPMAHVPPGEVRQWRSLIEYRRVLVQRRGAAKNRLRAILRSNVIAAPRALWTGKGLGWLKTIELPLCQGLQREQLLEELGELKKKIDAVHRVLKQIADKHPGVSLLMTIPGVGIRTAEAVAAYVDDPQRFRRIKSIGCYFGVVPCEDTSVKSRFGHITKEGPSSVRKLLTEATWQAIRRDATVRDYYQRVVHEDPQRRKIALVATSHHLLRVMLAMLRTGQPWRAAA
jgi:transposase